MNVSEALSEWLALRLSGLAPRTVESYRDLIGRILIPALGDLPIEGLTALAVQEQLLLPLCECGHTRTAQLCLVVLKAACRRAVRAGLLARSPVEEIIPPKHQPREPGFWSPEELRAFVANSSASPWAIAWQLALCCGLRRGELAGLRWADVDLAGRVLHICNQRQRVAGRGVIDRAPKSASGRRYLAIPDGLARLLKLHLRAQRARMALGAVFPVYVVSYSDNRPIDPHALNLALSDAIRRAGVRPISVHGLRHTMATLASSCGVPLRVLQSLLGHSSPVLTAQVYAHVLSPDQIAAVEAVSARVL